MLTPAIATKAQRFRAGGDAPANSLTRTLPQGADADILSLGCGDVRNILYTAYLERGFPSRRLDFTCCDVKADVHVRNVLFLSFLVDGLADDRQLDLLWDVYYHVYLDDVATALLRAQVRKLAVATDTLEHWRASSYGRHLRFCDSATFRDLQDSISRYEAALVSLQDSQRGSYEGAFRGNLDGTRTAREHAMSKDASALAAYQSAAPLFTKDLDELPAAHAHYWKYGITTEPDLGKQGGSCTLGMVPNPTFFAASASDTLSLHFSSDPLRGYHLATAFTPLTDTSPLRADGQAEAVPGAFGAVRAARTEFRAMAKAFQAMAHGENGHSVTVRFATADALALCYTLQNLVFSSGEQTSANWYQRGTDSHVLQLDVDEYGSRARAPMLFDVIDTSNLEDNLGTLDVLVAGLPLLADRPSSTLLTGPLLSEILKDGNEQEASTGLLCGCTPTVALLLGVIPVEYYTNARTNFSLDKTLKATTAAAEGKGGQDQPQDRLTWKLSHHFSGQATHLRRLQIGPDDLANALMAIYRTAFFSCGGFVTFMRAVMDRVTTDWAEACRRLLEMTEEEAPSLVVPGAYLQELLAHLHIWNVYSDKSLGDSGVTAVTFAVPRDAFDRILDADLLNTVTLALVVAMRRQEAKNGSPICWRFADIQLKFGTVAVRASSCDDALDNVQVDVLPDPEAWKGTSPLAVCFYVPTLLIQDSAPSDTMSLELYRDIATPSVSRPPVDVEDVIYSTSIADRTHVYISRYLPGHDGYAAVRPPSPFHLNKASQEEEDGKDRGSEVRLEIDQASGRATSVIGRICIGSAQGRALLSDKSIGTKAVVPISGSPFVVDVVFGTKEKPELVCPVRFPVPVAAGEGLRLRVARASAWVEVVACVAELPAATPGMDEFIWPTTLDRRSGNMPVILGAAPHTNLDALPILDLAHKEALGWLTTLVSCSFSLRERRLRDEIANAAQASPSSNGASGIISSNNPRVNFKESVFSLFMLASGLQGDQTGLFVLTLPEHGGGHVVILVSALRLDNAAASVVADAAVLPMTPELLQDSELRTFLALCHGHFEMCVLTVDEAELVLWKKALPAMAERCRTWSHDPATCAYAVRPDATIPLSLEPGGPVLCACGQGHLPPDFVAVPLWEEAAARYATRIAISPVFCDPAVELAVELAVEPIAEAPGPHVPVRTLQEEACGNCGATAAKNGGPLKKCLRCLAIKYCSAACQKQDWLRHRTECEESPENVGEGMRT